MQVEHKGYIIESLAEPNGPGWLCAVTVRRRTVAQDEALIRQERLFEEFETAEQAERAGVERGLALVDGLPKLPEDRLHPPRERG